VLTLQFEKRKSSVACDGCDAIMPEMFQSQLNWVERDG